MGNWGIKVTKSGYDVSSASVENQSLNSSKNTFKILKEGIALGTVTPSGTTVTVSVIDTFSSNTFPAFVGFYKVGTTERWYQPYGTETDSGKNVSMDLYLDKNHFLLTAGLGCTSGTNQVTVYFYELIEPSVNI